MKNASLKAISPVDGRYHSKTKALQAYYSEYGLIRYRVLVEVEYFVALTAIPLPSLQDFPKDKIEELRDLYRNFSEDDALWIKETEKTTNHDVKAVEYFLKEKMSALGLERYLEFIHFGLTSQDINNTAVPLSLKEGVNAVYLPLLDNLISKLKELEVEWKDVPMLARTHGQAASPTRLGKELKVFRERIELQKEMLIGIPFSAKFGGATGNFNAHFVAYPEIDWVSFSNNFVNKTLGLNRSQTTTQIEHYDHAASLFDALKRINTVLIDLDRDIWTYVSMDYFKQKLKEGEIGSSAMPHKVNPIDFENSEGNLGIANALYAHLSAKLPISRLQRDLTDSTVLRAIGVPLAHSVIAFQSSLKGLDKLVLNEDAIAKELENNWAVVAEAIQTVLRREGFKKPYEALKGLTRTHDKVTKASVHAFIDTLQISVNLKEELKKIEPSTYLGIQLVGK